MSKKETKKTKKELLNLDEEVTDSIVTTVRLEKIELKDLMWHCKLRIGTQLPRSYHLYKIIMEVDEQPFLERIEEIEIDLKSGLFENDATSKARADKDIAYIKKTLEDRKRECEKMQFNAAVVELKYRENDTLIVVRVADDIIEAFNRQKSRFAYYKITLNPIYS